MKNLSITELLISFSVFVFWVFFYPGHVLMKEQLSLFLYTHEFWKQYALQPGGWSVYCGNFLAQFYINQWAGALIQTLMCVVLMILMKRILEKAGARGNLLLTAVFPAMLLFFLQLDYYFSPGNVLTLLCPFALTLLYISMKRVMLRRLVFTLIIVPVYLFSGAVATCCLYAACMIFEWIVANDRWKFATTAWIIPVIFLPRLWQAVYLTPDDKLFQIMDYTPDRSISYIPVVLLAWLLFCILIPFWRLKGISSGKFPAVFIIVLLFSCGFFLFPKTYLHAEELKFRMYMAVEQNDWDKALKIGKRIKIYDQNAAWLINLSLAMKGELPQKMFSYPQTNEYGLLPVRERKRLNVFYGSAFYYHIGVLNDAIRWVYDLHILHQRGMDYHTLTRLAVWNKENGYEQVAVKYFDQLSHTLMYRSFARRERERTVTPRVATAGQVEFYFGVREPLNEMTRYYENIKNDNNFNIMIRDYVLCSLLLKNDLNKFLQMYEAFYLSPKELPKVYQEALLEIANSGMIDLRSYPVNPINTLRHKSFREMAAKGNDHELEKHFGDTWWYYSYRRNTKSGNKKNRDER